MAKQALWNKVRTEVKEIRSEHHEDAQRALDEAYQRSQKYSLKQLTKEELEQIKKNQT